MPTTVARIATELLENSALSSLTRKSYHSALTPFLEKYGRLFINEIERSDIEAYLRSLTHLSPRTQNRHQVIIQRLFSYAVERGYLSHNPATGMKRRKPHAERGEHGDDEPVRYLKKSELRALYKRTAYSPQLHALTLLLHESGARISEVLALDLTDINFEEKEFQVIGKGNKKRWCYFGEKAAEALKIYRRKHREQFHDALFTERHAFSRRVRRLTYDSAYREWKNLLADHPSLKTAGFHHLRHTFATERARVVPLEVLRALLGHENIQTTLIYQKITSQVAKEVAHNALKEIYL